MSKKLRLKKAPKERYGMICNIEFKSPGIKIVHGTFLFVAIFLSLICLLPLVWIMLSSFKSTAEFMAIPPTFLPETIDLGKFLSVWQEENFLLLYTNTIILAVGEIVICVVFNGLAGYTISRLKPKGSQLIFMLVTWTMLLPNNVSQVPLFMTFTNFPIFGWNLSNSYWPMWLLSGANCYYVLLFKSYFDSLSISFFESAKIDGCSNLQMFFKIVIPLSIPVICVIMIFQFNAAWGSFFWPYLLNQGQGMAVIGQKMYVLQKQTTVDKYVMAMVITMIPPSIMYIIFQKQIIGGLTVGGVKG